MTRRFWEPWAAVIIAAALYLRVAWGQWGGLVALAAELAFALVMRARLMPRIVEELELAEHLLSLDLSAAEADRLIGSTAERVHGMFAGASSTILAAGKIGRASCRERV